MKILCKRGLRDWQRLVFSYGDTGELIHPRLEIGAAKKRHSPQSETVIEAVEEPLIEPDLADRLDSLLDKPDPTNSLD